MTNRIEKVCDQPLRAVILKKDDFWVAQCLEVDIAVQARSLEELRERLQRTLDEELALSVQHGEKPFSKLEPAPEVYFHLWEKSAVRGTFTDMRDLRAKGGTQCNVALGMAA